MRNGQGSKRQCSIPCAKPLLRYLISKGYQIIIVTNQYLIGEGFITQTQYEAYQERLLSLLKAANISILDVFYCPHARSVECECRKPKTGLIEQALKKYPEIDLSHAFVVGDSLCDMQMAERFALDAYGIGIEYAYQKFIRVENLKELKKILSRKMDL